MKCINCGKEINDDARFCQYCGKEQIHVEEKVEDEKDAAVKEDILKGVDDKGDGESDINKESDSIKDADRWTKIIYYFLFVVCSLAFVLIVGGSIYYIVSPNLQEEPEKTVVEADSTDIDEMLEDSLPLDEPVKATPEKVKVTPDTVAETPEETEPVETVEPEVSEPINSEPAEPATEENKSEDVPQGV